MHQEIRVCWRSERAVIVDKPAGWLSVPARQSDDPRPCVGLRLEQQLNARLWPVHRLDVPVSGLMIFALDEDAHRALNQAFEQRLIQKTYEVWCPAQDVPLAAQPQRWSSLLLRGKKRAYTSPKGKDALTIATPLERFEHLGQQLMRWHLEPHTGRSHQLRVHMAEYAAPIINDVLYGGLELWPKHQDQIALRAVSIDLSKLPDRVSLPASFEVEPLSRALRDADEGRP